MTVCRERGEAAAGESVATDAVEPDRYSVLRELRERAGGNHCGLRCELVARRSFMGSGPFCAVQKSLSCIRRRLASVESLVCAPGLSGVDIRHDDRSARSRKQHGLHGEIADE